MLFLDQADARELVDPDELVDALTAAFAALSGGLASAPPRIAARAPNGLVAAMPVHLPGAGLEVKLVSVFAGNPKSASQATRRSSCCSTTRLERRWR
jgi:alanine dehydrogenase